MSREDAQMKIRLPAELKASIEAAAAANARTLNSEVVSRLQATFAVHATIDVTLPAIQMSAHITSSEAPALTPEQVKLAQAVAVEAIRQVAQQGQPQSTKQPPAAKKG